MRCAVLLFFSAAALAHTSCDSVCLTPDGFSVLSGQKIYGSYANASVKNASACQAMCCADLNCTAATLVDATTYSLCFLHDQTAPAPVPMVNNTVFTKIPCVTVNSDYGPEACTWRGKSCGLCGALKSAKGTQNIALASHTTVLNPQMCPLPKNATLNIYGDGTAGVSIGADSAPYGPLMEIPASTSVRFSRVFFKGTNLQKGNSVLTNNGELTVEDSVFDKWGSYVADQMSSFADISVIENKGVLRVRDSNFTSTSSYASSESGGAGGGNSASAGAYVITNSGEAHISGDCVFDGVSAQAGGTGGGKWGSTSTAAAGAVMNSGVLRADGMLSFAEVTAKSQGETEAFGLKNQHNGTVVLHNAVFTGVNASLASGAVTVCVGCSADPSSNVTGGGVFATCATTPPAYACSANTTCEDEPNGFGFSCN